MRVFWGGVENGEDEAMVGLQGCVCVCVVVCVCVCVVSFCVVKCMNVHGFVCVSFGVVRRMGEDETVMGLQISVYKCL